MAAPHSQINREVFVSSVPEVIYPFHRRTNELLVKNYRYRPRERSSGVKTATKIKYNALDYFCIGMTSNLLNHQIDDILGSVLEDVSGTIYMVNPSRDAIEEFISVATAFDGDLPSVRMLADERTLKDVMDDFIVASNAADLISEDALSLRTLAEAPENSLLVSEDRVVALVHADDRVGGLTTDDESFVEDTYDTYAGRWEDATDFNLRTPPITAVRETLSDEISPRPRPTSPPSSTPSRPLAATAMASTRSPSPCSWRPRTKRCSTISASGARTSASPPRRPSPGRRPSSRIWPDRHRKGPDRRRPTASPPEDRRRAPQRGRQRAARDRRTVDSQLTNFSHRGRSDVTPRNPFDQRYFELRSLAPSLIMEPQAEKPVDCRERLCDHHIGTDAEGIQFTSSEIRAASVNVSQAVMISESSSVFQKTPKRRSTREPQLNSTLAHLAIYTHSE